MMDAFDAIRTRRSIRLYTDQLIPDELVKKLLIAAMQAPSASNQQPWHFIVVTRREMLNALAEPLPNGKMLTKAPLGIVVCADVNLQKNPGYWVQDCSAAVQNILLTAHASGLGAVWLGVYPRQERVESISKLVGLPEHVVPLCVLSVGYPLESIPPVDRFQLDRVHLEQW